ncbi:NUDIX domain-containing protein [Candidatus Berkelbacteria bacterium]|nr:NUDIX domain-containing protein [Candidatus Berkelbacteria bacterium]
MPHPGQLHLVVPTCIVVKDGKILIAKRALHEKAYPGRWTVPGGKVDRAKYEQTPKTTNDAWYGVVEETLREEVREETGVEIETPQYLLDCIFIRPDDLPVVVLSFWAKWKSGAVVLSKDLSEYAWIDPAEAVNYDLIEGIPEEIKAVAQLLQPAA